MNRAAGYENAALHGSGPSSVPSPRKPKPAWRCLLRVKAQVSGKGKPFYRLTIGDRRLILLEEAGELLVYLEPDDGGLGASPDAAADHRESRPSASVLRWAKIRAMRSVPSRDRGRDSRSLRAPRVLLSPSIKTF